MAATAVKTPVERRPYVPYGAAYDMWRCKSDLVLIDGPAGTGKSRAVAEKIHLAAMKYPNMQGAIGRKIRADLTQSVLQDFEELVLMNDPEIRKVGGDISHRTRYDYPNGSQIWCFGMDNASRIMSTQKDMIACFEATEFTDEDIAYLDIRCRAGNMPYQQVICDCNPRGPNHHLKRAADSGKMVRFPSRHTDNPRFYDMLRKEWTPEGAAYMRRLERLDGVRRAWFLEGKWVAAEGVVYAGFDAAKHVIATPFTIPDDWRRIRSIDFGHEDPFVCFDDMTDILTENGWVRFADLPKGVPVAAVDKHTRAVRWEVPTAYIDQEYVGPMVLSEPVEEGANFCVTPNHQMVVQNRKTNKWSMCRADAMPSGSSIPVGWSPCHSEPDSEFSIPQNARNIRRRQLPSVSRRAFARFLGIVVADGCIRVSGSGSKYTRIAQKKHVEAVRAVLRDTGFAWSESVGKTGVTDFSIGSADLYDFLHAHGMHEPSHLKRVPRFVLTWGRECLEALLDGLMLGDGSERMYDAKGRVVSGRRYHTISKFLADDVQHIACLLGQPTRIRVNQRVSGFDNPATEEMYTVAFHVSSRAAVEKLKTEAVPYKGRVRCVSVPSGMIVVRRNGRPMVCGNCQWWAIDPDGRMYMYREIYMSRCLTEDHAKLIVRLSEGERIEATVSDHSRSERATLEKHGVPTIPAQKAIIPGIQKVMARLQPGHDGKPRMYFMGNALHKEDTRLREERRPCKTVEEMESYIFRTRKEDRNADEVPMDKDNHGADCARYACCYVDGMDDAATVFLGADVNNLRHAIESPIYIGALRFSPQATALGRDDYLRAKTVCGGWADDSEGPWRLWVPLTKDQSGRYRPPQSATYIIGCALSMTTNGYEAAVCVSRRETREQVAEAILAGEDATPDQLARLLSLAGYWFGGRDGDGCGFMLWEGNTPGTAMGRQMTKLGYPWMYYHADTDKRNAKPGDKYGWQPNPDRAQRLLIETRRLIATGEYRLRSDETAEACGRLVMHNSGVGLWDTKDHADLRDGGIERARAVALALSANGMEMCAAIDPPKRKAEKGTVAYAAEQLRKQEADKARGWWNRT